MQFVYTPCDRSPVNPFRCPARKKFLQRLLGPKDQSLPAGNWRMTSHDFTNMKISAFNRFRSSGTVRQLNILGGSDEAASTFLELLFGWHAFSHCDGGGKGSHIWRQVQR